MRITQEHLDLRICDVEVNATNTETYREFIQGSEEEFELIPKNLDDMTEKQLNEYIGFLDYLWEK
ncbi:hypothetical protein [Heyndrickxia camelliae]|uniref:Uncharacterized protein n=1 Tax=Heyndrickxia camelliae TaxID=1707093 RepID=A0A2N3LG11_9BACI|nr:hypothetical protein [Heyndrickxia camelliae]PKR83505.1 hypothetical protein CWO92_18220 [Heyndrickxia camelliae]